MELRQTPVGAPATHRGGASRGKRGMTTLGRCCCSALSALGYDKTSNLRSALFYFMFANEFNFMLLDELGL